MYPRRHFLGCLGALAFAPLASRARIAGERSAWLSFRPAAFEVTADSAVVWARLDGTRAVRVQYTERDEWSAAKLSGSAIASAATDYTVAVTLAGLDPDTRYRYRIIGADGTARDAAFAAGVLRTAPVARRAFAFAFSADTHARYRPFRLFDVMRATRPDFFIHLGDTVYADSPRSRFEPSLDFYRRKHREIRADLRLQTFLAEVPTFATWDDHEVANDFTAAHPALPIGRQAFGEYWPVRSESGDATVLYRRFRWSPACEFFMLDTRQYRDQGERAPAARTTMLGARQFDWLAGGLAESTAAFKFICSSVPFHAHGIDKWGGFKAERRRLVDIIRGERIRNVIVLSADLHAAADLSDARTGVVEFLVGPIAAPLLPPLPPDSHVREAAVRGSYVGDDFNFGLIKVFERDGEPALRHEVIDSKGLVRYTREIVASSGRRMR